MTATINLGLAEDSYEVPMETELGDSLTRASEIIRSTTMTCEAKSGGVIEAAVSINCLVQATSLGFTRFAIQEYRNGSWVDVKSTTNKTTTNAYNHSTSLTYTGATAGTLYRATATAYATYGGVTETRYPATSGTSAK